MTQSRRLAAIMFTDIAGYTALMNTDEAKALQIRNRHREVFEQFHQAYSGKILQYYGDGTLSIFESAIDAVNCAVAMQQAFQEEPKVPLRIGIHTGDIMFTEEEAIGDGVNVASRVESVAVPGSIMISEKVFDYIKNQNELPVHSMGTFTFKNVSKRLEVFAVEQEGVVVPDPKVLTGKFTKREESNFLTRMPIWAKYVGGFALFLVLAPIIYFPLYNKLGLGASTHRAVDENGNTAEAVAVNVAEQKKFRVSSFTNISGDSTLDWLGIGIPYALEMEWDQDPYVLNFYQESTRPFNLNEEFEKAKRDKAPLLLKGDYTYKNQQYELFLDFYNVQSGQIDRSLSYKGKDLFPFLDSVSRAVRLELGVPKSHLETVTDLPLASYLTNEPEAYQLFIEGIIERFYSSSKFLGKYEAATEIDPTFAWANFYIANFHHRFQRSATEAEKRAAQAMKHRKRLPNIFDVKIRQLDYKIKGQPEKALQLAEYLSELNPNNPILLLDLWNEYFRQQKYEKTLKLMARERKLNQGDILDRAPTEAFCLYQLGRYKKGLKLIDAYIKTRPEAAYALSFKGLLHVALEQWDEAIATFEKAQLINPESDSYDRLTQYTYFMRDSVKLMPEDWLTSMEGRYKTANTRFSFNIFRKDGKFFGEGVNQNPFNLYPMSRYSFCTDENFRVIFYPNDHGEVDRMDCFEGRNNKPYIAYKLDEELLAGMESLKDGDLEAAGKAFEKAKVDHPQHPFLPDYAQHVRFRQSADYAAAQAGFEELAGKYERKGTTFIISVKEGNVFMRTDDIPYYMDDMNLYALEKDLFLSNVIWTGKIAIRRKRGKIHAFEIVKEEGTNTIYEKL